MVQLRVSHLHHPHGFQAVSAFGATIEFTCHEHAGQCHAVALAKNVRRQIAVIIEDANFHLRNA